MQIVHKKANKNKCFYFKKIFIYLFLNVLNLTVQKLEKYNNTVQQLEYRS